jgi:hypothetical protein
MKKIQTFFLAILAAMPSSLSAQPPAPKLTLRALERALDPAAWTVPDKEGEIQASEAITPDGDKTLRFHVPVDYSGGQPGHPVGWPRMSFPLAGEDARWGGWDAFELMAMARTSRPEHSKPVCALLIGNRPSQLQRRIVFPAHGEWLRVKVSTAELKAAGVDVGNVPQIRLSVAESDYADKEVVDLALGGFRLVRAPFEVSDLWLTAPALLAGATKVSVGLTATGSEAEVAQGVPVELRQKDRVLRSETLPLVRGARVCSMDIGNPGLPPGDYQLVFFPQDASGRERSLMLKIIENPWKPL